MSYHVLVVDRSGTPAHDVTCSDFADCLRVLTEMVARYPDRHTHLIDAHNYDECDGDDGLTADEREQVSDAVWHARKKVTFMEFIPTEYRSDCGRYAICELVPGGSWTARVLPSHEGIDYSCASAEQAADVCRKHAASQPVAHGHDGNGSLAVEP